jgi:hypothetical protein
MKLQRYNQFLGSTPLNENLDKSKKFLKDQYAIKKVATDLKFINTDLDYDLRHGVKKALTSKDFTPEQFNEIRMKLRDVRLTDEQVRELERNPEFVKLRDLLQPNIGYLYNFVYMFFVEKIPYEEVERLYALLIEYKDLLERLPKKFDVNFIDESIPNPSNNHTNAEIISDELDKLGEYRKVKKIIDTLPPKLKKAANSATELQMEQLVEIANGFDKIESEKKELVWKTFFGEMLEDRYELTREGKPNPNFGKLVWRSRLFRFQQMDNPLTEFIKAAKQHLDASGSEGYSDRVEKINKVNDLLGVKGCRVVFNESGVLIVEVNSYAANKMLNAHCSHCIVNSESYWNSYLGEYNIQYYIYNFNLSSTNNKWTIGVTIKPDRTYQGGACQTVNNSDIGREFKSMLKNWEKEYSISQDLWSSLQPLSAEEIQRRKDAQLAEREIIKKTVTDPETRRERPITAEDIKRFVRESGADVNKDNGKALVNAVEDADIERVRVILQLGGSPNLRKGSESAISKAKDMEMIKLLVSHHAILTGEVFNNIVCDEDALEFCLKAGADPNFNSNLPIRKVSKGTWEEGKEGVGESFYSGYQMLLKYGANSETNGVNFIVKWAAEYGRMDIINDQMEKGCQSGFVDAFVWMGHTRKLEKDLNLKKELAIFLKNNAIKYEKDKWDAFINKYKGRNTFDNLLKLVD